MCRAVAAIRNPAAARPRPRRSAGRQRTEGNAREGRHAWHPTRSVGSNQATGRICAGRRRSPWQVTIAHTHGEVVAIAVWCNEAGYVGYREELAAEFLRDLRIVPPEPLLTRLRRALSDLRRLLGHH